MKILLCWLFGHRPVDFVPENPDAGERAMLFVGHCERCGGYHFGVRRPGTASTIMYNRRNPHVGLLGNP